MAAQQQQQQESASTSIGSLSAAPPPPAATLPLHNNGAPRPMSLSLAARAPVDDACTSPCQLQAAPTAGPAAPGLRSPITTHVLDTALGVPACGLPLSLTKLQEGGSGVWATVGRGVTNEDGRCAAVIEVCVHAAVMHVSDCLVGPVGLPGWPSRCVTWHVRACVCIVAWHDMRGGRVGTLMAPGHIMPAGRYRMTFDTATYLQLVAKSHPGLMTDVSSWLVATVGEPAGTHTIARVCHGGQTPNMVPTTMPVVAPPCHCDATTYLAAGVCQICFASRACLRTSLSCTTFLQPCTPHVCLDCLMCPCPAPLPCMLSAACSRPSTLRWWWSL